MRSATDRSILNWTLLRDRSESIKYSFNISLTEPLFFALDFCYHWIPILTLFI